MVKDVSQFHLPNHLLHLKIYFKTCILISMDCLFLWCVPFSKYPGLSYFKGKGFLFNECSRFFNFFEDAKVFKGGLLFLKHSLCAYLTLSVNFLQIYGQRDIFVSQFLKIKVMETRPWFLRTCTGLAAWVAYRSECPLNATPQMTSLVSATIHTTCSNPSQTLKKHNTFQRQTFLFCLSLPEAYGKDF